MLHIDLFNDFVNDLKENKAFFILCDGYDGWSWGMPVNPICLTYTEYGMLLSKLKVLFNYDLENQIVEHNGWDCILPDEILTYVGKKVTTFTSFPDFIKIDSELPTEQDWDKYLFKTAEEKQKSVEAKKELLQKIGYITENPSTPINNNM